MRKIIITTTLIFASAATLFLGFSVLSISGVTEKFALPKGVEKKTIPSGYYCEIPVILYHNIDGVGPFSVTSRQLEEHFKFFKDNDVTIISLAGLRDLLTRGVAPQKKYAVLSFDDGYPAMKSKLLPIAKKYGYPVSLFIYIDYIGEKGGRLLTWDDLRMLDAEGLQIESHTMSHADLLKTQATGNPVALYREIYLSKRIIELMLDRSIDHFAFPYGSYNRQTLQLADAAGYERLYTTEFGANISSNNNVIIKRHHVKNNYTLASLRKILDMK